MSTMAALGFATFAALAADAGTGNGAPARIDHVILGVSSLEAGTADFAARTGVTPAVGGQHPGIGTQNALASLGGGTYLEILAPVPGSELAPHVAQVKGYAALTPMGWAVTVDDAQAKAAELAALGYQTTGVVPGSRDLPDGSRLEWAVVVILDPRGWQLPFFIDWVDLSRQPSTSSPGGCQLASFTVLDPEPAKLQAQLAAMGATVPVKEHTAAGFEVALRCPKGEVKFSTR